MPRKASTREDMRRAERDVGENRPAQMVGEDDGDVRDVERDETG